MICLFVSWKQGKISRSTSITSITSKPNKTSTVQSKTTSTSLHFIAFSFHNTLSLKLLLEMLRLLLVCHFQEQLPPRIHWIHWLCGLPEQSEVWLRHANHDNQYTSIGEMSVKNIEKSCISKQCIKVSPPHATFVKHTLRAKRPECDSPFCLEWRKSLQKFASCRAKQNTEKKHRTTNSILDRWMSEYVGITRASKRSTLTCCETTTTESSKLLKAFWLHKNKAISFGCLGTNASSGHSLQMTNEHAGKLLAKPTASYVCSKSLKPLQAIQ